MDKILNTKQINDYATKQVDKYNKAPKNNHNYKIGRQWVNLMKYTTSGRSKLKAPASLIKNGSLAKQASILDKKYEPILPEYADKFDLKEQNYHVQMGLTSYVGKRQLQHKIAPYANVSQYAKSMHLYKNVRDFQGLYNKIVSNYSNDYSIYVKHHPNLAKPLHIKYQKSSGFYIDKSDSIYSKRPNYVLGADAFGAKSGSAMFVKSTMDKERKQLHILTHKIVQNGQEHDDKLTHKNSFSNMIKKDAQTRGDVIRKPTKQHKTNKKRAMAQKQSGISRE